MSKPWKEEELTAILTEADRLTIATTPDAAGGPLVGRILSAADKTWDFANTSWLGGLPLWVGTILERLSDDCFTLPRVTRPLKPLTFEGLKDKFLRDADDALGEHQDWWEQDPDDYRINFHRDFDGKHPWGDENVAACKKWLDTVTPYSVWRIANAVQEAVHVEVEDHLLTLSMDGSGSHKLTDAAQRTFDEQVTALWETLTKAEQPTG